MTNTAEMTVRIGQLDRQLQEASAGGFHDNPQAAALYFEARNMLAESEPAVMDEFGGGGK